MNDADSWYRRRASGELREESGWLAEVNRNDVDAIISRTFQGVLRSGTILRLKYSRMYILCLHLRESEYGGTGSGHVLSTVFPLA